MLCIKISIGAGLTIYYEFEIRVTIKAGSRLAP